MVLMAEQGDVSIDLEPTHNVIAIVQGDSVIEMKREDFESLICKIVAVRGSNANS